MSISTSSLAETLRAFDDQAQGRSLMALVRAAYPICRSLTGDGVRQTFSLVRERIPVVVHEVPSGTSVYDWTVPREWNLREAWIKDAAGRTVVDARAHNLHVLGYSVPVKTRLERAELDQHLYSLPEQPALIPYRTSYYQERWGFCLPHAQRLALGDGEYEVLIDATLEDGSLTYGEYWLPGERDAEVLLSCHVCHPSLCNDNLSGITVMTHLAQLLGALERRRYSYRFLFVPGTIGALTWLSRNEATVPRIGHGLVAANLGDGGKFHYKRTRRGSASIDRAVTGVLARSHPGSVIEDFVPFGYDERQYASPGFDLPVGSLTRTPWGRYPEYHTSADDLEFVRPEHLAESLRLYLEVMNVLEAGRVFLNLSPKGEPQLGRRGLYSTLGGGTAGKEAELALLWLLNQSDGASSLRDIAERSGIAIERLEEAAARLVEVGLLVEV